VKQPFALLLALVTVGGCSVGALSPTAPSSSTTGSSAASTAETASSLVAIGAGLRGPAGLAATVDATGPADVSALAFDDRGRLWLATAAYSDGGTDGVYLAAAAGATPTEVVPGLHTVLGLLWYEDELYVAAAGGVTAYGGFDGARFATQRTVVSLPSGAGEVNGIVLGPDGRMRLGISAPCDHCSPTAEYSASVVSFEPDGSDLRIEASGIRAPVGLAYVPGTDDLLVSMDQRDDLGAATPGDWLGLVGAGQSWGFPGCYGQGGTACAGVPSPVAVLDPHAAVSGVAIVTGSLGATGGTAALVAEWSLGRIERVTLESTPTGYTGTATPFLTGIGAPVAVIVAPDGAVLVGDWNTGTVYRIAPA
jgi:glucose/arabinose dehydrogenase